MNLLIVTTAGAIVVRQGIVPDTGGDTGILVGAAIFCYRLSVYGDDER